MEKLFKEKLQIHVEYIHMANADDILPHAAIFTIKPLFPSLTVDDTWHPHSSKLCGVKITFVFSLAAFTNSPLCATAINPCNVSTTKGWTFTRSESPCVEYRVCPATQKWQKNYSKTYRVNEDRTFQLVMGLTI